MYLKDKRTLRRTFWGTGDFLGTLGDFLGTLILKMHNFFIKIESILSREKHSENQRPQSKRIALILAV